VIAQQGARRVQAQRGSRSLRCLAASLPRFRPAFASLSARRLAFGSSSAPQAALIGAVKTVAGTSRSANVASMDSEVASLVEACAPRQQRGQAAEQAFRDLGGHVDGAAQDALDVTPAGYALPIADSIRESQTSAPSSARPRHRRTRGVLQLYTVVAGLVKAEALSLTMCESPRGYVLSLHCDPRRARNCEAAARAARGALAGPSAGAQRALGQQLAALPATPGDQNPYHPALPPSGASGPHLLANVCPPRARPRAQHID
jgi:hypothetical protein